jgi:hypothetical protein
MSDVSKYQSFIKNNEIEALLSLRHNREQANQIIHHHQQKHKDIMNKQYKENMRILHLVKEQKIKVYPSKIIDEQKR